MPDDEPGSTRQRAEAARVRAEVVRKNAEEVRRRAAAAHDRYAALAERWSHQPDSKPAETSAVSTAGPTEAPAGGRISNFRLRGAETSEKIALAADTFADYMEVAANRGDRERRLAIAKVEREIAKVERRNAARLRRPDDHTPLESIPKFPSGALADEDPEDAG